ncbi:MAG: glutathione synthase [Gammaproteobacteria bacterium]|nr:glutathione synthase [Gammaproteobacteria bacterium]MDH5650369.1 glutathione synthase [Gammaproteobacteria bacterium]
MKLQLGVVMDPIGSINYKKDSTLAMLLAAGERDYSLFFMEQADLFVADGRAMASMTPLQVFADPQRWYEKGDPVVRPLGELDAVLMRKDPPFDMDYIYSTYILELAEAEGSLIVNRPQSLRDCNEKLFITRFPQCIPPTLVSCQKAQIRDFLAQHRDIILKPLDSMGGTSIFRVQQDDPNINVIIETLTANGRRMIMAQRYIPEIKAGDKRILLIDGDPVPYTLARIPTKGETRANLATGGEGVAMEITARERWICEQIAPTLRDKGLLFVGIDVIGDYLTEINVTSPTCIRELDKAYHINIGATLMEAIEATLQGR